MISIFADSLVIIVCFFSIRIRLIRVPAILILISTVEDLFAGHLLEPEVKEFLTTLSIQDADAAIATLRMTVDLIGTLLNVFGVAGLIIIVLRHKLHCAARFQSELAEPGSATQS